MQEIRQLTVLGRYGYTSIPTITHFAADAARSAALDEDEVFHCQMAVDEACTNIIEHAYGEDATGNIEITCFVEPGICTIQIVDHGRPFNPDSVPVPRIGASLDEIKPGGIGLHLMRRLMDEVRFEFTEHGNRLTMKKIGTSQVSSPHFQNIPVSQAKPGIWIVEPQGRLDATTAPDLEHALETLVQQDAPWILVDLARGSYISSRGLKVLVSSWRKASDNSGKLALCAIIPRVLAIFETVGFTQIFDVYPNRDDALTALSALVRAEKG
jgi:anti-anti-sigma factor